MNFKTKNMYSELSLKIDKLPLRIVEKERVNSRLQVRGDGLCETTYTPVYPSFVSDVKNDILTSFREKNITLKEFSELTDALTSRYAI
jgi:hypothetical protein